MTLAPGTLPAHGWTNDGLADRRPQPFLQNPNIAAGMHHRRSEPAPCAPPSGAGSLFMRAAASELRTCSTCRHWDIEGYATTVKEGYREAVCLEPADARDRKSTRGSDYCSRWSRG